MALNLWWVVWGCHCRFIGVVELVKICYFPQLVVDKQEKG